MTTLAETRLHERAATLAVRQVGARTWRVASATRPGVEYIVKGAAGEPFEALCCNCEGGRGRCGHKTAVALRLNIPIPGPAERRRPATQTPTSSSLVGDPAAVLGAVAGSAGESHDIGGTMRKPGTVVDDDGDEWVMWRGCIPATTTALRWHGDGGGRINLDLPRDAKDAYRALLDLTECELEIAIRRVGPGATSKESDHAK